MCGKLADDRQMVIVLIGAVRSVAFVGEDEGNGAEKEQSRQRKRRED